tara:strand:+ start:4567 stop:5352 length:786 start_codon:yes stop_codon:yes gene_type:complete
VAINKSDLETVMKMLEIEATTTDPISFNTDNLEKVDEYLATKDGRFTGIELMDSFDEDEDKVEFIEKNEYHKNLERIQEAILWLWENPNNAILTIDNVEVFLVMRLPYVAGTIPEMFETTKGCYAIFNLLPLWNPKTETLQVTATSVWDIPGLPSSGMSVLKVLNASRDADYASLIRTQLLKPADFDTADYDLWFDDENDWNYTDQSTFAQEAFSVSFSMGGPNVFAIELDLSSLNPLLNWVSRNKDLTAGIVEYATHMKV